MSKEEKLEFAKEICLKLEIQIEKIKLARIDEINADICLPTESQRGLGGIIIGDDGAYLVCGSIKSTEDYIQDYKNGERTNM